MYCKFYQTSTVKHLDIRYKACSYKENADINTTSLEVEISVKLWKNTAIVSMKTLRRGEGIHEHDKTTTKTYYEMI